MKILVTGGCGFIGSNFIRYWLKNNKKDFIVNLDKLTYAGHLNSTKDFKDNKNYKFIKGDICDTKTVEKAMKTIDIVIHFAAETHVDRSIKDPDVFIKTNIIGTKSLLDSALENNVKRFHHVSTDEVFGELPLGKGKFSENTGYDPRSPYSASKASSDHLVRSYYYTYGLPITVSNCSNNYGPYQFPEKIIPFFVFKLLKGEKVPVYGDGLNVRDWIHAVDHSKALDLLLHKGNVGEVYNIGSDNERNNLELTKMILSIMGLGEDMIEYIEDRPGHDRRYAINWSKIKTELGWEPLHTFDEWLGKTVEWYGENTDWWKEIKSGVYKDYYNLQYQK
jgi:dTDP-glucose 4,6-dehydratase